MILMWKILKTTEIFKHPRITLLEDDIELPNGNATQYLKFQTKGDGADAVAINREGKILLVKEYNHPPQKEMWQFPGGFIDKGETPEQAVVRELMEEGGFKANTLRKIGYQHIYRRRIEEVSHCFIATDLEEVETNREESEFGMQAHWFSEAEIDEMVRKSEITASDALAIWAMYKASK